MSFSPRFGANFSTGGGGFFGFFGFFFFFFFFFFVVPFFGGGAGGCWSFFSLVGGKPPLEIWGVRRPLSLFVFRVFDGKGGGRGVFFLAAHTGCVGLPSFFFSGARFFVWRGQSGVWRRLWDFMLPALEKAVHF